MSQPVWANGPVIMAAPWGSQIPSKTVFPCVKHNTAKKVLPFLKYDTTTKIRSQFLRFLANSRLRPESPLILHSQWGRDSLVVGTCPGSVARASVAFPATAQWTWINWDSTRRRGLEWKCNNRQDISIFRPSIVVLSIFTEWKHFCASSLSSSWRWFALYEWRAEKASRMT